MRRIIMMLALCSMFALVSCATAGAASTAPAPIEQFTEGAKADNVQWIIGFCQASGEGKLVMMAGYREWELKPAKGISLKGILAGDLIEAAVVPTGDGYELVALINHKLPDQRQWEIIKAQFQEGKHAAVK